jgi:hypothetical protein
MVHGAVICVGDALRVEERTTESLMVLDLEHMSRELLRAPALFQQRHQ